MEGQTDKIDKRIDACNKEKMIDKYAIHINHETFLKPFF